MPWTSVLILNLAPESPWCPDSTWDFMLGPELEEDSDGEVHSGSKSRPINLATRFGVFVPGGRRKGSASGRWKWEEWWWFKFNGTWKSKSWKTEHMQPVEVSSRGSFLVEGLATPPPPWRPPPAKYSQSLPPMVWRSLIHSSKQTEPDSCNGYGGER
ncbi:uncharacterized protein LOC127245769 isoform X2 [Andrographis paniculata]|uniref:uncharacterized protein LOC127245769 isoform X2 n=1 Tax=Andrographis paniculata TaxID=175694 RepID=UPI0021E7F0AB|nr:uncharacterized protein LOC127245769 isoform X2 [Andrographis paniculata]